MPDLSNAPADDRTLAWRPEGAFERLKSKVDGITVFRAAPPIVESSTSSAHAEGPSAPTPAETSRPSPRQRQGSRPPAHDETWSPFRVDLLQQVSLGWGVGLHEAKCAACGVQVAHPPAREDTCPWCGGTLVSERSTTARVRPRVLIPAPVSAEGAASLLRDWLSTRRYVPDVVKRSLPGRSPETLFLPYWLVRSSVEGNWEGDVPHTRHESVRKNGKWESESRTVWEHEKGEFKPRWEVVGVPAFDLQGISPELLQFEWSTAEAIPRRGLEKLTLIAHVVELQHAWLHAHSSLRADAIARNVPSGTRNLVVDARYAEERWTLGLAPAHVYLFPYEGALWRVVVNAQNGAVGGAVPTDRRKLRAVVLAAMIIAVGLFLIGVSVEAWFALPAAILMFLVAVAEYASHS